MASCEPADVEIDGDADVIVLPSQGGKGNRRRFHKPLNFYTDKPGCFARHQHTGWKRKQRAHLRDFRSPCKRCYDPKPTEEYDHEKDCPLCGEPVTGVARHIRNDCEANHD